MFEADKFSDTRPKWNLIDHNNDLPPGLLLFLKREYSSFLGNIDSVYAASAIEINSKNLLVIGKNKKIVLKMSPEITREDFECKANIYKIINEKDLPSIKVIDAFFQPFDSDTSLIVSHYCPGNYYSGSATEFASTFNQLKILVENFPADKLNLFQRHYSYPENSNEVVIEFFKEVNNGNINFDADIFHLLKTHEEKIFNANLFAEKFSHRIGYINDNLGHIDLHPHNIIVQDMDITLLDVDALMLSKWPLYAGFGIFKLLRQSKSLNKNLVGHTVLKEIVSSLPLNNAPDSEQLKLTFEGAKWEIMRRLQIIMSGNIGDGQSQWNSVLPIQIKALAEVEFLENHYSC